jgi:hypothetical protein
MQNPKKIKKKKKKYKKKIKKFILKKNRLESTKLFNQVIRI